MQTQASTVLRDKAFKGLTWCKVNIVDFICKGKRKGIHYLQFGMLKHEVSLCWHQTLRRAEYLPYTQSSLLLMTPALRWLSFSCGDKKNSIFSRNFPFDTLKCLQCLQAFIRCSCSVLKMTLNQLLWVFIPCLEQSSASFSSVLFIS